MNYRTDLAVECTENTAGAKNGLRWTEDFDGDVKIIRVFVENEDGARAIGKPIGQYITIEVPPFGDNADVPGIGMERVATELRALLPPIGAILVVGLGNRDITPDALGPKTVSQVMATRHISGELARSAGMGDLRQVVCLQPGVLGRTGMESSELIGAAVGKLDPAAVVTVDALASRRLSRLGCTVQIADSGIVPGSGVGNARAEINAACMGVPVFSIGVPTVVDAATLAADLTNGANRPLCLREEIDPAVAQMMVTPREVDLLIERAARMLAMAINRALQPHLEVDDFLMMTE
ncbi:MAG: GPR endopeptidase [Oscillospiraceae bacterium]|jgi:spore protease|nr:GPR endopeptidase [Oscillospiraceae bacterium]